MTESHPNPRRSRLRALALGLVVGLGAALLAASVGDVAGRLAGDDPLRARARRVVTTSPSYLGALDLARTSPVILEALDGVPRAELDSYDLGDDGAVTRLRFALRLETDRAGGRLDVVATCARGADWVERVTFTRDAAAPVDLTVTLPAR
jgi:hypothetical protein